MPEIKNEVFISYAREDLEIASRLYQDFRKIGLNPWFDQVSLLPGQRWKIEIKKAIRNSRYFLALLSLQSVSKRGYVQKELREALDALDEFTDEEVYIIPVRMESCQPKHVKLQELQWVDIFPSYENGYKKILAAMELPIEGLPIEEQPLIQTDYGHLQTEYSAGPEMKVTCGEPGNESKKVAFQALIDTGAAVSLIPEAVIQTLNLTHGERVLLRGSDGRTTSMETVYLDLYIGSLKIEATQMIVMRSRQYGLIGRDILKDLLVMLDGPKGTLQIFKTSSSKS